MIGDIAIAGTDACLRGPQIMIADGIIAAQRLSTASRLPCDLRDFDLRHFEGLDVSIVNSWETP